jgi:cytochrome c-type biogenesis protein CcmE
MLAESVARPETASRPRRRRKVPITFIIAGLAVAGAVLYLVIANTGASAEFYMTIKELRACTTCADRSVRVAGNVADNSITHDASQAVHFTIVDGADSMPVVYAGTVPDTFRAGVQVVVEGKLVNGVFKADNLLAKCPSKFQSATPGASGS